MSYWKTLEAFVRKHPPVIDRKKGTAHPAHPGMVYPVDYGYLPHTTSMDGSGIDIFVGEHGARTVNGVMCVLDLVKEDSEIKILTGCDAHDIERITSFLNSSGKMSAVFVPRIKTPE